MSTADNFFSSAAEDAGALSKTKLSSMGWLSGRLGQEQSLYWHGVGSCTLPHLWKLSAPQHALWQARPLGMGRECRSSSMCQWKQTTKETVPSNALGWNIPCICQQGLPLTKILDHASQGVFPRLKLWGEVGSILLQSDPFSHSLLGYFSGNEIPTHKEAKH